MKIRNIVFIIIITVLLDQTTKFLIQSNFELNKSYELINNFYYITYYENTGIAFGMFNNLGWIIIVVSMLLLLLLIYELTKYYDVRSCALAFSILIGGLIGNLIDRIMFGYVRDFLDFNPFGFNFPIFNISDVCIIVGSIILIISTLELGKSDGKKDKN